jgi:hypothetical protein
MLGVWPVSELVGILSRALADGTLSPSEQAELAAVLERITGA